MGTGVIPKSMRVAVYLSPHRLEIQQRPVPTLGPNDVHLYRSPGHQQDWLNCIRNRRRPICDVAVGWIGPISAFFAPSGEALRDSLLVFAMQSA